MNRPNGINDGSLDDRYWYIVLKGKEELIAFRTGGLIHDLDNIYTNLYSCIKETVDIESKILVSNEAHHSYIARNNQLV